jgi:hypothetical protein
MAVVITSPEFSFVGIVAEEAQPCSWGTLPCLPVSVLNDLSFQLKVAVSGADKAWFNVEFEQDGDTLEYTIQGKVCIDCEDAGVETDAFSFSATWTLVEEGTTDHWIGNFVANGNETIFNSYDIGQCFNLCFHKVLIDVTDPTVILGLTTTPIVCSDTCFARIDDTCYTSVLTYSNDESAFDFNYDTAFFNTVRLNLYLHSPVNVEEEKSYSKSDGSTVKLMHRIWKDYKVKTDLWGDHWLEKLAVATAHDTLRITCTYSGIVNKTFVRMEKIDIGWLEQDSPGINVAQGNTTLRLANPRASINSNCL